MEYRSDVAEGDGYKLFLGDSVEQLDKIETESVGLAVFSPPFPGMYTYTNSPRDIGNSKDIDELMNHFRFMMPKILRVLKPG